jgi:hypothetical protein
MSSRLKAVKKDLVGVLLRPLQDRGDAQACENWLEALICSPSLLQCVALDVTLSPVHLAMSRELSNYHALCSLQLMRDSFFRRVFELLQQRQDSQCASQGALQELRMALFEKYADGNDGQALDKLEESLSSSALLLLRQICMGSPQVF